MWYTLVKVNRNFKAKMWLFLSNSLKHVKNGEIISSFSTQLINKNHKTRSAKKMFTENTRKQKLISNVITKQHKVNLLISFCFLVFSVNIFLALRVLWFLLINWVLKELIISPFLTCLRLFDKNNHILALKFLFTLTNVFKLLSGLDCCLF